MTAAQRHALERRLDRLEQRDAPVVVAVRCPACGQLHAPGWRQGIEDCEEHKPVSGEPSIIISYFG